MEKCGAPADLIQVLTEVTIENSQALMEACDLIIATGGSAMVKAAYSSGTPAYGVGPGNPPVVLDRGYDLTEAAKMSVVAVGSDNGILCDGDNLLLYPQEAEKDFFDALKAEGVVLFENKADVEEFGKVLFHDGHTNPELVGKDAPVIAKAAGFDIPADTKVGGSEDRRCGQGQRAEQGDHGAHRGAQELRDLRGGRGHGYPEHGGGRRHRPHCRYLLQRPRSRGVLCRAHSVARVLVNQPTPDAWGPSTNGLSPAVSESCGTWGNNILCENVDYRHLINISKIALPLDVDVPSAEELFKD